MYFIYMYGLFADMKAVKIQEVIYKNRLDLAF